VTLFLETISIATMAYMLLIFPASRSGSVVLRFVALTGAVISLAMLGLALIWFSPYVLWFQSWGLLLWVVILHRNRRRPTQ
jgi:hypothetical protein